MFKIIYQKDPETGKTQKVMDPVTCASQYCLLRNSEKNLSVLGIVRTLYDEHRRMASEGATAEELKQHKDLIDQEKRGLVEMNYSCIPGPDMLLKGSTQHSPWVGSDVDFDPSSPDFQRLMDEAPQKIIGMAEELGLGMLERSAGKGFHAVFRRHLDMTQEENLRWFSGMIGCAFDERAKDITRVFFSTSAAPEDLLYLSPDLFAPEANQPVEVTATAATARQPKKTVGTTSAPASQATATITPDPSAHSYMGHTFQEIIGKYWELFNGGKAPCDGARNTLTYELALNLRCIRDFDVEKLLAVIPVYDGLPVDEWRQVITNANNETRKGMTYRMRKVLEALRKDSQQSTMPWGMNDATPPLYTGRMPEPLRKMTSTTPQHLKTTVSEGVFGALATHLHGVTFRLIDGKICEPAIMQILIYRQSRGKGCIDEPIEAINADLLAHDLIDRARENEWRRNNPSGGNKKKEPRPEDIYWQCCQTDFTHAAFTQRLIDCDRNGARPVFLKMVELDEITALSTNGKQDVSRILRLAFDRKTYGQERVSSDAVSGVAPLRLNFTAATTPIRAREMCLSWVSDGTLSRCNLLTIDPSEEKPKYKPITQKYRDDIAPYIDRLNKASGLIRCKKAEQLAKRLSDELDDKYAETGSESLNIFASRAVTIAYWKAMILYIMMGKWSADIESYIEFSLRRDIWVKLHFFGEKMEADILEEENMRTFHPRNVLDGLQSPFSEAEFMERRKLCGCKGDPKEHLKKLRQRHKIDYDDTIQMYVILKPKEE